MITKHTGEFQIRDLESHNGTFVNGVPVKERFLNHGDTLQIGTSLFLFLLCEEGPPDPSVSVQINDQTLFGASTARLVRSESLYLQPEKMLEALPAQDRIARNFSTLLKISTVIKCTQGLPLLKRQLLELILEVIPAQRGAILLFGNTSEQLTSSYGWQKHSETPVKVSRSIIESVLKEDALVLSNDASEYQASSVGDNDRINAFIAAPVTLQGRVRGVIYVDTSDPATRFDDDAAELMTAVAAIAAMPLENALQLEWFKDENLRLQTELNLEHNIVGESHKIREIHVFIAKVAPTDATVLIYGESGTGKELVANALHRNSSRAQKPFVAINCAVLTENLLESELFGHEKGAFTGAIVQKKGKLELAEGGSLFLDEVGELAPLLQAKLLRVLQEREFERVGGTRKIQADIRVMAATNKDLTGAVGKGLFRQDLYYRLNVVSVNMPPLRERGEDILLLATYFLAKHTVKTGRRVTGLSAAARASLMNYGWPGNVRELENAIQRATILGSADMIMAEDLPESIAEAQSPAGASVSEFHKEVKQAKRQIVLNAISEARGNMKEAAKALGVHPTNLYRLVRTLTT